MLRGVRNVMDTLFKDLRYTLRTLVKAPVFTLAAVAALTLGIGANTAIFSVVNAVLLRPVAVPEPDRLVYFMNTSPQGSGPAPRPPNSRTGAQQTTSCRTCPLSAPSVVNYTGGDSRSSSEPARSAPTSSACSARRSLRGRTFTQEEDRPGAPKVAVLSHGFWARRFGSDPAIVGKTISLGGEPHTVVGILGPVRLRRDSAASRDVWIPFQLDPNTTDQGTTFRRAGRLKPGVTLEQAKARLKLSAQEFRAKYPERARQRAASASNGCRRSSCATCARHCCCWRARSASSC